MMPWREKKPEDKKMKERDFLRLPTNYNSLAIPYEIELEELLISVSF
jgi:hypothetical protein